MPNVQKRACNVYLVFQLSFNFAYHRWWLGKFYYTSLSVQYCVRSTSLCTFGRDRKKLPDGERPEPERGLRLPLHLQGSAVWWLPHRPGRPHQALVLHPGGQQRGARRRTGAVRALRLRMPQRQRGKPREGRQRRRRRRHRDGAPERRRRIRWRQKT